MFKLIKKSALGTAAALAFCAVSQLATAGPLGVSIAGQVCFDGQPCDLNAAANQVTVIAGTSVGITLPAGFTATIGTSFSNNPGGTGGFSILDLTWTVSTIGAIGGPLTIISSQDGFTFGGGTAGHLSSTISGDLLNGSLTAQQFLNSLTPGVQGPFTAPFTSTLGLDLVLPASYSLSEFLSFTMGANGTSTGDFRSLVTRVPEPGTLALLGLALAGMGFVWRRKQA